MTLPVKQNPSLLIKIIQPNIMMFLVIICPLNIIELMIVITSCNED